MKTKEVAKFFDCMRRSDIPFTVDDVNTNFKTQFGVESGVLGIAEEGHEAIKHREGTFLAVYVLLGSLCNDVLVEALGEYMKGLEWWIFNSPYGEDEDEVVYIINLEEK